MKTIRFVLGVVLLLLAQGTGTFAWVLLRSDRTPVAEWPLVGSVPLKFVFTAVAVALLAGCLLMLPLGRLRRSTDRAR